MTSFTLTAGGVAYTLDLNGGVSTAAGAFGTWTTDGKSTNQIVLTPTSGAAVSVPVVWSFNASNQLCVAQDAHPAFSFTVSAVRPALRLDSGNKLHVTPAPGGPQFEFTLVCGFALAGNADLEITINGGKSVIKGVPTSNSAYFGYTFRDKAAPTPEVFLAFTGEWVRDTAKPDQIDLIFKFAVDGTAYQFTMPAGSATAVSQQNKLFVTGVKNGQAWGVSIDGALAVRKDDADFSLVFSLAQQHTAAGVKTTEIAIKAVFAPDDTSRLNTALDLYIGATKTPTSKRVTVKGQGHVALGDKGLDITFAYADTQTAGHTPVVALMVGTTFSWKSGKLEVTYQKDGKATTVALSSAFVLKGKTRLEAYLNIKKSPTQSAGVYGALGLSW